MLLISDIALEKISEIINEIMISKTFNSPNSLFPIILIITKMIIKNNSTRTVTSDWYKINDYNVSIDKFISAYDGAMTEKNNTAGITNETNMLVNRQVMTEEEKKQAPLHAEKTEIITYKIIVKNDAVAEGTKYATQVRPSVVRDEMEEGLTLQNSSVAIKSSNGTIKYSGLNITHTELGGNVYEFRIDEKLGNEYVILDPGDYIEYTITVEVTKTNMYLHSLRNTASFTELTNINSVNHSRIVTDQNITPQDKSSEYVKLKDLVIAGKVWLDTDRNGFLYWALKNLREVEIIKPISLRNEIREIIKKANDKYDI